MTTATETTYPTSIVWGLGSCRATLDARIGAADAADVDAVADHLVAAGVAERTRRGVAMLSSADEPWCCVTTGRVDEQELDTDPAVLGYQIAAPRA